MDGTAEVWGELQPLQGADRETRGALRQLSQDRPPHGLPQRVLRSPTAAGLPKCFFLIGQEGVPVFVIYDPGQTSSAAEARIEAVVMLEPFRSV